MLEQGMRVTINSDDPAYFPGYMNENLIAVQAGVDLARDEVLQLGRNAFTIAWLPEQDKHRYLHAVERYGAQSVPGGQAGPRRRRMAPCATETMPARPSRRFAVAPATTATRS
jgi:adenosine deaminase